MPEAIVKYGFDRGITGAARNGDVEIWTSADSTGHPRQKATILARNDSILVAVENGAGSQLQVLPSAGSLAIYSPNYVALLLGVLLAVDKSPTGRVPILMLGRSDGLSEAELIERTTARESIRIGPTTYSVRAKNGVLLSLTDSDDGIMISRIGGLETTSRFECHNQPSNPESGGNSLQ